MAYNFGQYRYSMNRADYVQDFLTTQWWHHDATQDKNGNFESAAINDMMNHGIFDDLENQGAFYDKALVLKDKQFLSNTTYYLKFKVKRQTGDAQYFRIGMLSLEEQTAPGISIQKITDFTLTKGNADSWMTYQIIFTPNQNFSVLIFELVRDSEQDFRLRRSQRIYELSSDGSLDNSGRTKIVLGRHMDIRIMEIATLQNIVSMIKNSEGSYGNLKEIIKIGIQGPPGLYMGINGEQIQIGGSGIYQINNDLITIDSLNIVPIITTKPQDSYFIVDFEYNT